MVGQIIYRVQRGGGLLVEETSLRGLHILRLGLDPDSMWMKRSVKRAGRILARSGARRILAPEDFSHWPLLERCGLREVEPVRFLRAQAAPLALAMLEKNGHRPERCAVALRGNRVDRGVERTAVELCARVRDVCISIPRGGEALQQILHREFGVAVRPDHGGVEGAVRYSPDTRDDGAKVLDLFGIQAEPGGLKIKISGLVQSDTPDLHLAAVLWEGGQVEREDLEFT